MRPVRRGFLGLLVALCLLWPMHAWAVIAHVQSSGKVEGTATIGNTIDITLSSLPAVGNMVLVVGGVYTAAGTTITVSDNQGGGNTYTEDIRGLDSSGAVLCVALIFRTKVTVSSGTFTVKISASGLGTGFFVGSVEEWTGQDLTSPLDKTAQNGTTSAGTSGDTGTTATTSIANELVVAVGVSPGTPTTWVPDAGWTQRFTDGGTVSFAGDGEDKIVAATGTQILHWTFSSAAYSAAIATYKAATSAGTRSRSRVY